LLFFEPEEYKILYILSRIMDEEFDEESFEKAVFFLAVELDLHGCSIWKKNIETSGISRLGYHVQLHDNFLPHLDYTVAQQVISSGQQWSKNWFELSGSVSEELSLNNGIALPLIKRDKTIGAICFWMPKDRDSKLSNHLAKQLTKAITDGVVRTWGLNETSYTGEQKIRQFIDGLNRTSEMPFVKGIHIAARSLSPENLRSDFYDFCSDKERSCAFILGDTMGAGPEYSVMQFTARTVFHAVIGKVAGPGIVLSRINKALYPEFERLSIIMGLVCAMYEPDTRVLKFSNAGYLNPIICSKRHTAAKRVKGAGPFLGLSDRVSYENNAVKLISGDVVVFFSDGVSDLMNNRGEMYSLERLQVVVEKYSLYDAHGLLDCLFLDIGSFLDKKVFTSDITLIVLKVE
jgi:hypothetical protein